MIESAAGWSRSMQSANQRPPEADRSRPCNQPISGYQKLIGQGRAINQSATGSRWPTGSCKQAASKSQITVELGNDSRQVINDDIIG